jgi:hypothetical protein
MDQQLETISLDIEEPSEFLFSVKIEGADPAPTKIRMVCEQGDLSYMFSGKTSKDGLVQFNIPAMKNKLSEGLYQSRIEVLVGNRYFSPTKFQLEFKNKVKVVAEAVVIPQQTKQEVKVTALKLEQRQVVKQEDYDLFI